MGTINERLQEALVAAVEAAESGQAAARDAVLARYPAFADELREFFAGRSKIDRLARPLRDVPPVSDAPTTGLNAAADAPAGTRIQYFGDYELLEEIGRGGMGVVYKARQVSLKRIVALKMILTGQLADDADVRRFHAEAEAAAKLDHPGIVTVFEVGKHEGHHYFSMAFVEGESLARQLAAGLPPPRRAAELIKKVAEAVSYAHVEGVIHRDLKPANILIDATGQPRLTDFGLAKRVQGEPGASATGDLTATGQVLGTPSYMPPEQASGQRGTVGTVSDVYSLGAVLYCMLTGRPPFQAATPLDTLLQVLDQEPAPPRQLNRSIPRDLETICLKCLEKEPGKRYASARDLVAELERYLAGQPIHARPASRRERVVKWMRRRPTAAALLGVSAAAVLGFVALGIALVINANRAASEAGKREIAERERGDLLTAQVAVARNHIYSSDTYLAGLAFENNDSKTMANYLDGQRPKPGDADLRGFEWRYLWRKNNLERLNLLKSGIVSAMPQGDELQRPWVETRRHRLSEPRLLAFSPDGKYLATTRDVCDAATGKVLIEYDDVEGSQVFFSHDSTILFAGWRLFDLTKQASLTPQERGKAGFKLPHGAANRLVPLGFLGKQNAFVVMTSWRPARNWDHQKMAWNDWPAQKPALKSYDVTGKETAFEFNERKGLQIEDASFSAATGLLAVAMAPTDHYAKVLDVDVLDLIQNERKAFKVERTANYEDSIALVLSPDGATLAIVRPNSSNIGLCDLATGKEHARLDTRNHGQRSACFSADSKTLLVRGVGTNSAGYQVAKLKVWHVATGKQVGDWQEKDINFGYDHDGLAVLSPDGKTIATASPEKPYWPAPSIVKLWDTATGKLRAKFISHRHPVYDIAFSQDGKSLATLDNFFESYVGNVRPPNVNVKVWDLSASLAPLGPGAKGEGLGADEVIGLPLDVSMITVLDPSPDGKTVAVGFANGKIQLCEAATLKVLRTVGQDSDPVRAGQKRSSIPRTTPVDVLMFSPDGKLLAASHRPGPPSYFGDMTGGNIDLWDVAEDTATASFPGFLIGTRAFNGKLLAATSTRGPFSRGLASRWDPHSLTIWDLTDKKSRLEVKNGVICAFSPDGRWAALGAPLPNTQMCELKLRDLATGAERTMPHRFYAETGNRDFPHAAVFSPDGKYLALSSVMDLEPGMGTGYAVRVYDVATGETVAFIPGQWRAVFAPDGKMLATVTGSSSIDRSKMTLWDTATGKELGVFSNPDKLWCDYPVFSPDGKTFAALTMASFTRAPWRDGKIITDGSEITMTAGGPNSGGTGGSPGKDGHFSVHPVHEIHVWDIPSALTPPAKGATRELKHRNRFIVSWQGHMEALAFSRDGQTICSLAHFGSNDTRFPTASRLQAWDAATGKERGAVGDQGTTFHGVAFAPDGRLLTVTQQRLNVRPAADYYFVQHKMRLWDATQQKELTEPRLVPENVLPMSINPSSLTLVSGATCITDDGAIQAEANGPEVKLTERTSGNMLHVLKGNTGATRLAFAPDGKTLAVGLNDGTIRLWNVAAGRHMLTIQAHAGPVTGLAFRTDGRVLASCNDTEIRLWSAATDEERFVNTNPH